MTIYDVVALLESYAAQARSRDDRFKLQWQGTDHLTAWFLTIPRVERNEIVREWGSGADRKHKTCSHARFSALRIANVWFELRFRHPTLRDYFV